MFACALMKEFKMLHEEEDPLTCEDTCDDWFQESLNHQDRTGADCVCELVQPADVPKAIDATTHRWPDVLALKLGGNPTQANERSGLGTNGE
jgi:hypothetical protein